MAKTKVGFIRKIKNILYPKRPEPAKKGGYLIKAKSPKPWVQRNRPSDGVGVGY